MNAGQQAAEHNTRYTARTQGLKDTYNGQDQQEIAKDVLEEMCQGINETPHTFYSRVITQANRAGYDAAFIPIITKQVFMKGIHRDICTKMNEQPHLNLNASVTLANRIWQNAHHLITQEVTLFP